MRIEPSDGVTWTVLHGPKRECPRLVAWIDTDALQWAQAEEPLRIGADDEVVLVIHQAKTIKVHIHSRVVEIDTDWISAAAPLVEIPPECHNKRPINADTCMDAVRAMCGNMKGRT